jgi:hypothetical protein
VIWKGRKRQQVAGIPYGSMMFSEWNLLEKRDLHIFKGWEGTNRKQKVEDKESTSKRVVTAGEDRFKVK